MEPRAPESTAHWTVRRNPFGGQISVFSELAAGSGQEMPSGNWKLTVDNHGIFSHVPTTDNFFFVPGKWSLPHFEEDWLAAAAAGEDFDPVPSRLEAPTRRIRPGGS